MNITIRSEPREIFIQTVSVSHDSAHPDNVYLARCYRCTTALNQIQGVITRIFPGIQPTSEVQVIRRCDCGELYSFQTQDAKNLDTTRVTLSVRSGVNKFHCWLCRQPSLQFDSYSVALLPSGTPIELPYKLNCFNQTCGRKYDIVDVV